MNKSIIATLLALAAVLLTAACTRPPEAPPVVLFDQGHGQHFLIENDKELDLSKLADVFRKQGYEVRSSNEPFTDALLDGVHALVISGAFKALTPGEINALKNYLDNGGQIAIMLHIGSPVARLLNELGIAVSNGIIREQANLLNADTPTDFFVTDLADHPLTRGLKRVNFYGSWAIDCPLAANSIARTTPRAWVDLNGDKTLQANGDAQQAFSVIVTGQLGHGQFVVFADDAIFQNRFLNGDNATLAANLARWFK